MKDRRPFRCRCFGCEYGEYACSRCNLEFYDWPPHEDGWLWDVLKWIRHRVEFFIGRKCGNCGKRYRGGDDYACSEQCAREYIPF